MMIITMVLLLLLLLASLPGKKTTAQSATPEAAYARPTQE